MGMLGPILDTILVCTITGLIIIISGAYLENDLNGQIIRFTSKILNIRGISITLGSDKNSFKNLKTEK